MATLDAARRSPCQVLCFICSTFLLKLRQKHLLFVICDGVQKYGSRVCIWHHICLWTVLVLVINLDGKSRWYVRGKTRVVQLGCWITVPSWRVPFPVASSPLLYTPNKFAIGIAACDCSSGRVVGLWSLSLYTMTLSNSMESRNSLNEPKATTIL